MRTKKIQQFIISADPYKRDIFVVTGLKSIEELRNAGKKEKLDNTFFTFIDENKDEITKAYEDNCTFLVKDKCMRAVVSLKKFEDTWSFYETLIHELHHYIFALSDFIGMERDMEPQAYLIEELFRKIRRKLQGYDK